MNNLPNEIIRIIFIHINKLSRINIQSVCKLWWYLIKSISFYPKNYVYKCSYYEMNNIDHKYGFVKLQFIDNLNNIYISQKNNVFIYTHKFKLIKEIIFQHINNYIWVLIIIPESNNYLIMSNTCNSHYLLYDENGFYLTKKEYNKNIFRITNNCIICISNYLIEICDFKFNILTELNRSITPYDVDANKNIIACIYTDKLLILYDYNGNILNTLNLDPINFRIRISCSGIICIYGIKQIYIYDRKLNKICRPVKLNSIRKLMFLSDDKIMTSDMCDIITLFKPIYE